MTADNHQPVPEALTFLRLQVDMRELFRLGSERGWGRRGRAAHFDEGRALHHALVETFGEKALATWRLMVPPGQGKGSIYAYSRLPQQDLTGRVQLCTPELEQLFCLDRALQMKNLPTRFASGTLLGFDVRLRPIRRTKSGRNGSGVREIDAYLHEALQHVEPDGMEKNNRTRERVYNDWLAERLGDAATLETGREGLPLAKLARFRRDATVRRNRLDKGGIARDRSADQGSEGPDAVIQGTLQVKEPEAFARLVANGIGRHKTYGFGMLLLRPPHQPPMPAG